MADLIVIGAGVIGASVAFRLAQTGASVIIFEAGRVGGGTSGASFAWTNGHKAPRVYHDLNVAGMRAHAALREEFGQTPWYHGGGTVEWCRAHDEQAGQRLKVEQFRSWGYPVEWITSTKLKELEPDIDLASVGEAPIAFYPAEGWLDPVLYAHAMIAAARRYGAQIHCGARVNHIQIRGDRVSGLTLANGESFGADIIVNCTGLWADEVARMVGFEIPLTHRAGLLVFTPPVPTSLSRIVLAPSCRMRPDGGGRLMLGADHADEVVTAKTEPTITLPVAHDLVRRAADVLPSISGAKPEAVRIGIRPIPADGFPAVGPVPNVAGYYLVVTHSGVTLAPLLARAVATELVHGQIEPQFDLFRPGRFAATAAHNPTTPQREGLQSTGLPD